MFTTITVTSRTETICFHAESTGLQLTEIRMQFLARVNQFLKNFSGPAAGLPDPFDVQVEGDGKRRQRRAPQATRFTRAGAAASFAARDADWQAARG
jgi:hypothetical protein